MRLDTAKSLELIYTLKELNKDGALNGMSAPALARHINRHTHLSFRVDPCHLSHKRAELAGVELTKRGSRANEESNEAYLAKSLLSIYEALEIPADPQLLKIAGQLL